jgi:hypothetical protein
MRYLAAVTWNVFDNYAFLSQLGLIPKSGN